MKKLKLTALELGANEVLSRAQMKNVLGGSDTYTCERTVSTCGGFSAGSWIGGICTISGYTFGGVYYPECSCSSVTGYCGLPNRVPPFGSGSTDPV